MILSSQHQQARDVVGVTYAACTFNSVSQELVKNTTITEQGDKNKI